MSNTNSDHNLNCNHNPTLDPSPMLSVRFTIRTSTVRILPDATSKYLLAAILPHLQSAAKSRAPPKDFLAVFSAIAFSFHSKFIPAY